jgi:hypothetical protein
MTFLTTEVIGLLAREHHRELMEAAAERRQLRVAREAHPSNRRRRRSPQPPHAA